MPLFQISNNQISLVKSSQFALERDLQRLVEGNLEEMFGCRFVATEFSTGEVHGGRIDTLALSEENHPVIIEYKKVESSDLVNQSLFYLSWIYDHKGDFQLAVHRALGNQIEVDWSNVRVICIAPGYKKYDLHAVRMMGANIELYEYKLYENQTFTLEEVFQKNASMMELGKSRSIKQAGRTNSANATSTQAVEEEVPVYTLAGHLDKKPEHIRQLVETIRESILSLDESIDEVPKKMYVAYKVTKNFVTMEVQQKKIYLYFRLSPKQLGELPKNARDVTNIGHFGTGDLEYTIRTEADVDEALKLVKKAFEEIGG